MVFLRVVAILALLPGLAAGEEGLVVSDGASTTPVAQAAKQSENESASAPADASDEADRSAPVQDADADQADAKAASAEPKKPTKPKVDWSKVSNPVAPSAASADRGEALYGGKALCLMCHGPKGDGFGAVRGQFNPFPNAFFELKWHAGFSDGELMGILTEGKLGTGMIPVVPDFITEKEGWDIINYIRTLKGRSSAAYERYMVEETAVEQRRQEAISTERF